MKYIFPSGKVPGLRDDDVRAPPVVVPIPQSEGVRSYAPPGSGPEAFKNLPFRPGSVGQGTSQPEEIAIESSYSNGPKLDSDDEEEDEDDGSAGSQDGSDEQDSEEDEDEEMQEAAPSITRNNISNSGSSASQVARPSQVAPQAAELVTQWDLHEKPPVVNERPPKPIEVVDIEVVIADGTPLETEVETIIQQQEVKATATHQDVWYRAPNPDTEPETDSEATDSEVFVQSFTEVEKTAWRIAAGVAFPASDSDTDLSDDD